MKKQIIAGMGIVACAALCAAVWPRSAEVEDLPAKQLKAAVTAEIEAQSEEMPQNFLSADTHGPEADTAVESEPPKIEITAEEEVVVEQTSPAKPAPRTVLESIPASTEPKSGDRVVIDGKPHFWIPGFGWIKDEGGGSVGTTVGNPGDELTGNKVGQMGSATVGSNGDINKQVGIMSEGTVAEDMYENGHKIGIMGNEESAPHETTDPPGKQPVPTGNVVYIELQPPVTKDSTPPPYKPNGEPTNP